MKRYCEGFFYDVKVSIEANKRTIVSPMENA